MFENCPRLPTGRGGMFICPKLGQNRLEMKVRTFVRIQRLIWDHLLAGVQGWNYPEPSFISVSVLNNSRTIIMSSSQLCSLLCFLFGSVSSLPRSCFRLNHVRKVRKRCSHSRFSFQALILGSFDRNVGLCFSCFSVSIGDCGYFRWVKQWREVKDQSSGKGGRTQIVQGSLQALLSRAPPSYSKANLGITHTESLFPGYFLNPLFPQYQACRWITWGNGIIFSTISSTVKNITFLKH